MNLSKKRKKIAATRMNSLVSEWSVSGYCESHVVSLDLLMAITDDIVKTLQCLNCNLPPLSVVLL